MVSAAVQSKGRLDTPAPGTLWHVKPSRQLPSARWAQLLGTSPGMIFHESVIHEEGWAWGPECRRRGRLEPLDRRERSRTCADRQGRGRHVRLGLQHQAPVNVATPGGPPSDVLSLACSSAGRVQFCAAQLSYVRHKL
jgi:hypothetical protein